MDDATAQLTDKLRTANNILVTVSRDPSVDQLAACLGLTLLLNKQGKHAAAVFSGNVPSTIEFLKPEETLEKNTDSLRDFIIALDKSKADKLRYKVEDNVVRIFITPYKTSINQDDFEFSEGDFNVDVVVALGVKQQEDLDEAITSHGRILHDATVTSINTSAEGGLGTINWHVPTASSLSELVTELIPGLGDSLLDEQIATALLTGIVSETDRFSNDKTTSETMSASATLMAAGANQQVVASQLEASEPVQAAEEPEKTDDGTIEIDHKDDQPEPVIDVAEPDFEVPTPVIKPEADEPAAGISNGPKLVTEAPTMGGDLTANSRPEPLDPVTDPLSLPNAEPPQLLNRKSSGPLSPPPADWSPPPPIEPVTDSMSAPVPTPPAVDDEETLAELEESVNSSHVAAEHLDSARDEVDQALNNPAATDAALPEPIQALNAQQLGTSDLHPSDSPATDTNTPPPVPPPIPFQFGTPPSQQ
jgi:hypothetical protein